MRKQFILISAVFFLYSCETATFDKDKRQIAAKNAIREKLRAGRNFDIIRFKEDTLTSWPDTVFKRPIRYTLNFVYTDSAGVVQNRDGIVLFTPDGKSMMTAQVTDPHQ